MFEAADQRPPASWFVSILGAIGLAPLVLPTLWLQFASVLALLGTELASSNF